MHIIDIYRSNQYRRLASCEQGCPSKSAIRENQHRYWAAARYEDSLAPTQLPVRQDSFWFTKYFLGKSAVWACFNFLHDCEGHMWCS